MRRLALLLIVFLAVASVAQDESSRGPSTRAERDRAVKVTHELETDPLSPQLQNEKAWLLKWIQAVPDITVNICIDPVEDKTKYRYDRELMMQKTFSSAAYIIETSARSRDDISVEVAGVEGALKAYEAILKKNPQAHSQYWDRLLKKRNDGTLHDYVARYMETACGSEQVQT